MKTSDPERRSEALTEQRGGEWSSPERQEDEKYQQRMKEFFAPGGANGAARHPLRDDTTVMPPVGTNGSPGANDARNGSGVPTGAATAPGSGRLGLRRLLFLAGLAVAALLLISLVAWLVFGGGETGEAGRVPVARSAATPEVKETNLVFEAEDGEGDAYAIRLGEYEWEGTEAMNGDVEEVVLEGRTAAHFTTAVRLADGQITTGVFGRAEPGKPLWHATFQRTTTNRQQTTTGTYQVVDDGKVVLEGAYTDRVVEDNPGDEPDVVVREYVEGDPAADGEDAERYRVSFRAAEGVLIPWLPGWQPPAPEEAQS